MNRPLIITCAITGAETTRERQPALPITPTEQAQAAEECVRAGASIIHLHVRDESGKPTQSVDRFREAITAIRARVPEAIIQISMGGAVGESIDNRAKPLSLKPDMASLNVGTMNFGDEIFYNHPKDVVGLAERMRAAGIMPELEIYEAGHLEAVYALLKKGVLAEPLHMQFVLGVPGGMSGDARNLMHLVSMLPSPKGGPGGEDVHWGVAGVGRHQLPLAVQAIVLGGHVRVGFEDNIWYSKGVLATSNAQLVERVARISREVGREVATPAQSRAMLGLGKS